MAEIGVTLREARMRAGIDISEVEARTKIRAKYLRALENEEWSDLPGPTFVKSFLRTYADALGLDAKLLVEEYKFRHEPYEGVAATPARPTPSRRGGGGAFGPARRSPVLPLVAVLVVVIAVVAAVYLTSSNERESSTSTAASTPTTSTTRTSRSTASGSARRRISLRISVPSDSPGVFACVKDARDRSVLNGRTLEPGSTTKRLTSTRFDIALGSARARVSVRGDRVSLPPDDKGVVAYRLTRGTPRVLPEGRRPRCDS